MIIVGRPSHGVSDLMSYLKVDLPLLLLQKPDQLQSSGPSLWRWVAAHPDDVCHKLLLGLQSIPACIGPWLGLSLELSHRPCDAPLKCCAVTSGHDQTVPGAKALPQLLANSNRSANWMRQSQQQGSARNTAKSTSGQTSVCHRFKHD